MQLNHCPGCNQSEYHVVGKNSKAINNTIDGANFCQPDYQIRVCCNCGLYYKSHIAEESELSEYYQKTNFHKWEPKNFFPTETFIIKTLLKLDPSSRILDFGCSTGRLLSQLTNKYDCYGVEINQQAAAIAQDKGIKVISEQELLSSKLDLFDAIVLCDVFEHLINPTLILEKLCKKLKIGGFLIICTGNANAKACQNDIANFWYFRSIEHLCMLSEKYASFIEKKLQIKLEVWHKTSHYKLGFYEYLFQNTRNFLYWQLHGKNTSIFKYFWRFVPIVRRAKKWNQPPYFVCSKDHVVAMFQK